MQTETASLIETVPVAQATARIAGSVLVLTATTFNAALCFISTVTGIHFSATTVIICELVLLSIGLYAARDRITEPAMRIIAVLTGLLIGLKFVNPGLDMKILHDLAIGYIFYQLGTLSSARQANRLVWIVVILVLCVSSVEVTMPKLFSSMFNVWSYYVDKGVLATGTINYGNQTSFISGMRAGQGARTFFPGILGQARFSSVFLEPVSMGNFAVIIFAWSISVKMKTVRLSVLLIGLAALCAILSDSRFAFVCWFLMVLLRITPLYRSKLVVFCIPLFMMLAILTAGSLNPMPFGHPYIMGDNFPGRLLFSGRLLNYWSWRHWLALAPSPVYTSDTGYAYAINNLGLPIALAVLGLFAMLPARTPAAASMKAMLTVYMGTSLCIGANMFTIKTAALAWFLLGAANAAPPLLAAHARQARPMFRPGLLRHASLTHEGS